MDHVGFWGGPIKGYTITLVQGLYDSGFLNYGPLLGPLNKSCCIILRTPKGTIILISTIWGFKGFFCFLQSEVRGWCKGPLIVGCRNLTQNVVESIEFLKRPHNFPIIPRNSMGFIKVSWYGKPFAGRYRFYFPTSLLPRS